MFSIYLQSYLLLLLFQIACRALKAPLSHIQVDEVNTKCVPNTTVTAESTGTDAYGAAVKVWGISMHKLYQA